MRWKMALIGIVATVCTGFTCTVYGPGGGWSGFGPPPLDQTNATINIGQTAGGVTADIDARITDSIGLTVTLQQDQAVLVNGTSLSGPNFDGKYTATIPAAGQYTVTVREPTRGVQTTNIYSTQFDITAPPVGAAASLSGFSTSWSNVDPHLQVTLELSQTRNGFKRTQTFGPFADNGGYAFTAADLRYFVQGESLNLVVVKANTVASVAGFNSATLTSRVWVTRQLNPAP